MRSRLQLTSGQARLVDCTVTCIYIHICFFYYNVFVILKWGIGIWLLLLNRLEEERVSGSEARAALRNLVLMISSLCACGFSELRPTRANTELFQLQGFVLPQPSTPGQAVRNVQAFQVFKIYFFIFYFSSNLFDKVHCWKCSVMQHAISPIQAKGGKQRVSTLFYLCLPC